jgi:hypothetical protein
MVNPPITNRYEVNIDINILNPLDLSFTTWSKKLSSFLIIGLIKNAINKATIKGDMVLIKLEITVFVCFILKKYI